jgi:hypothetical protein
MIIDKAGSNNSNLFILRRNLILRKNTAEIIKEFKNKDIDCLILKGLYLAFTLYPDVGLRPMTDVDLLVKKEDLDRITDTLKQLGYTEVSPWLQRVYGCAATFSSKDKGCSIDIHWDICQYERFKGIINITGDFWMRAVGFNLDELPARTLSVEDHILYVSLHYGLLHLLVGSGAYDLFYLIDSRILDWETVINNAYKYGIQIPLYYSLLKASKITCLKLPDFVLERLKPSPFKRILLNYLLFRHKTFVLRYLCQALLMRDFSDTFKVLWRLLKGMRRQYNRRSIQATLKNIPEAIRT